MLSFFKGTVSVGQHAGTFSLIKTHTLTTAFLILVMYYPSQHPTQDCLRGELFMPAPQPQFKTMHILLPSVKTPLLILPSHEQTLLIQGYNIYWYNG